MDNYPSSHDEQHDVEAVARFFAEVDEFIAQSMVAVHHAVEYCLVALLSNGHVLIEDVPGTGKTSLAHALARSLGLQFRRVQFTPDLMPSDILGVSIYRSHDERFEFQPGPIFTQVLLADERNRATPRAQAALLEAMQERQVTVDGVSHQLPAPFFVIGTQNPRDLDGTYPLPNAELDRFLIRVAMPYPEPDDEKQILAQFASMPLQTGTTMERTGTEEATELSKLQEAVLGVVVDPTMVDYLHRIVGATRADERISLGASPRAGLHLMRAAQALAAIRGRRYVLPDDIKELASPVLTHRLALAADALYLGQTTAGIVQEILEATVVPLADEPEVD
jgi:MoxR-like ATPase